MTPNFGAAIVFTLFAATGWTAKLPAVAQPDGRKAIAFSGRVESVDLKLRTVAVKHGTIQGFMPAMTMDYPIDNDKMLKQLAPADEITATVYVGDPTLYDVHVIGHGRGEKHR